MSTATPSPEAIAPPPQVRIGFTSILLCVLISSVVTLLIAGGAAVWVLRSGRLTASADPVKPAPKPDVPAPSHVLALEPLVVNLADANERSFLRADISLRIADEPKDKKEKPEEGKADKADKTENATAAELRDTTLMVLSGQSSEAVLAPGGRDALKAALKEAFARHDGKQHVLDVYFTEFLVQRG